MKYIAIFDIPDDYGIGCAVAKVIQKDKYPRCDKDFENADHNPVLMEFELN